MRDGRTLADPAHCALSWKWNCAGITEKLSSFRASWR